MEPMAREPSLDERMRSRDEFSGTDPHCSRSFFGSTDYSLDYSFILDNAQIHFDFEQCLVHTAHIGQLKLFCALLEALLQCHKHGITKGKCVYPGSAPGHNVNLLAQMFPDWTFVCWDPRPMSVTQPNIYYTKALFKVEDVLAWTGNCDLLFSDIRSDAFSEEDVDRDNKMQLSWVAAMKPKLSVIKFRTSFKSKDLMYKFHVPVEFHTQQFRGNLSTETRLWCGDIIDGFKTVKEISGSDYESTNLVFNIMMRPSIYANPLKDDEVLDGCYDCTGFGILIMKYLAMVKKIHLRSKGILFVKDIIRALRIKKPIDVKGEFKHLAPTSLPPSNS